MQQENLSNVRRWTTPSVHKLYDPQLVILATTAELSADLLNDWLLKWYSSCFNVVADALKVTPNRCNLHFTWPFFALKALSYMFKLFATFEIFVVECKKRKLYKAYWSVGQSNWHSTQFCDCAMCTESIYSIVALFVCGQHISLRS